MLVGGVVEFSRIIIEVHALSLLISQAWLTVLTMPFPTGLKTAPTGKSNDII